MKTQDLIHNIEEHIIGKREVVELALTALLAGGHLLLEDVPGVGKTKLAAAMAGSCGGSFQRIQMTPDVMPSDVLGYTFWNQREGRMEFHPGAVFCNFLLVDEINRCSPKTQSALLEAMEERQVSVEGHVTPLESPFMVIATQNPVETYGTYPLPEAQLDRFLMKLSVGYPSREDSVRILELEEKLENERAEEVITREELVELQAQAAGVRLSDAVREYIVSLAEHTRDLEGIRLGISPRGCLALQKAARAYALLNARDYVLPEDIKALAPSAWGHRLILTPGGKSNWGDGRGAIAELLEKVEVIV